MTDKSLTAYKAFKDDMTCRGFQYEVGQTYRHNGEVSMCRSGFHACTVPFDCWDYYAGSATFAKVELDGVSNETQEDSKHVAASITIRATLSLREWITAQAAAVVDLCRSAKGALSNDGHAASTGDRGHAAAKGKNSIATSVGLEGTAEGALGTWLVLACYDDDLNVQAVRTAKVDGDQIKPDTSYRLVESDGDYVFHEA